MLPWPRMNRVHGHEVLKMMMASGNVYTKTSLTEEIVNKFGANTRFYTCSADDLTAAGLVEFLDARGKLVRLGNGIQTSPDLLCQH